MAAGNASIDAWHAYRYPNGDGEVVIVGHGFGAAPGSVKLNVKGGGRVVATIKSWTEGSIVVEAPADKTIQVVNVQVIGGRGSNVAEAITKGYDARDTKWSTAPWTVSSIDDSEDTIVITGTDLDSVVDVFVFDSAAPRIVRTVSFAVNDDGTELQANWPASFTPPVMALRLTDAIGKHVTEHIAPNNSGWVPAPNGLITDYATSVEGASAIISIIGSGFGDVAGSVRIKPAGGEFEDVYVLSNGWSDSLVSVSVRDGVTYEEVELTRADGEIATEAATAPDTIIVPPISSGITISSVTGFPLGIRVEGTGLLDATWLRTYRAGVPSNYDRAGWFGLFGGTWTDTVLEIRNDYGADNLPPVDMVIVEGEHSTSDPVYGSFSMDDPGTTPEIEISGMISPYDNAVRITGVNLDTVTHVTLHQNAGDFNFEVDAPFTSQNDTEILIVDAGLFSHTFNSVTVTDGVENVTLDGLNVSVQGA